METLKLSTIVKFIYPELEELLTPFELEMPVVLRDGITSVTDEDVLEIIEASINLQGKGALLH